MNNNFITVEQSEDLRFIKDIIRPVVDNLQTIEPCSDACNTFAYLVNKHIIVKFAKNEKKLEKLILERDILAFLKGKTTLKVPENNIFENHFTFSVHEIIKGETLSNNLYNKLTSKEKEKFCYDTALFMYELHSLTKNIQEPTVPNLKGITDLYPVEKIKEFLINCEMLQTEEQKFIKKFCDDFEDDATPTKSVFGHFDIQPKNIAFDFTKNEIAGIYDFGDCGFGDIIYDFTKLAIQYNSEILDNVLNEYEALSVLKLNKEKILKYSTYYVLYCLMRDIENGRSLDRGLYELKLRMI